MVEIAFLQRKAGLRVRKRDGSLEPFDPEEIVTSCLAAGASSIVATRVAAEVAKHVYDGISTAEVAAIVSSMLRRISPKLAERYAYRRKLMVRTSKVQFEPFDKRKIVESLQREAGLRRALAERVASEVEKELERLRLNFVTAPLIREIVNAKLLELGLEKERARYTRLGMPVYDVRELIHNPLKENANLQWNPETLHKVMADQIAREYALLETLPLDLADAHMRGEIHIHDMEYFSIRPFCLSHDLRFFLRHGFKADGVGDHTAIAGPAKKPEVAFLHAAKILAAAQTNAAGGQGFSYFNIFLAPYVQGLAYEKVKQLAQMFIFEMSVDAETKLLVRRNGEVEKVRIGELIDELMERKRKAVQRFGATEVLLLDEELETLTCDDEGEVKFARITGVSRHISDHLLEIEVEYGIKVRVTGHHSLYTLENGKPKAVRAEELKPGDELLFALPNFEVEKEHLNLFEALREKGWAKRLRVTNLSKLLERVEGSALKEALRLDERELKEIEKGRRTLSFGRFAEAVEKLGLKLEDIAEVRVTSSTFSRKKYSLPMKLPVSEELLRLIGYVVADGYFNSADEGMGVGLAVGEDQELLEDAKRCVREVFGAEPFVEKRREWNLRFGGRLGVRFFLDILKIGRYDHEREIPAWILFLPREKLREFLRAYFSGDGYVSKASPRKVGCSSVSEKLIEDLRFCLLRFNVLPSYSVRRKDIKAIAGKPVRVARKQHELFLQRFRDVRNFASEVGFTDERRNSLLGSIVSSLPTLPDGGSSFFQLRIKSIRRVEGEFVVYDVEVNDYHKFIGYNRCTVIYSNSQMYVARGGQVVFSSIDCDTHVPEHLRDVPAVLPGGEVKDLTYGDFEDETRTLFNAIVDVYSEGDYVGKPFNFPKFEVQLYPERLKRGEDEEEFLKVSQLAAKFGTPYYIVNQPYMPKYVCYQCCSYLMPLSDANQEKDLYEGTLRGGALQVVTVNLPQLAYEARGDDEKLIELLRDRTEKAKRIHLLKRVIVEKNLRSGLLPFLSQPVDEQGTRYLEPDKQGYIVGMVGLNEMLKAHLDEELHESSYAWRFGLKVIYEMKKLVRELQEETGLNFSLARTPAESCAHRLAQIDLRRYQQAKGVVNAGGEYAYYTNSFHVRPSAPIPLWKRLLIEGSFHPLMDGGSMSHIWLAEACPSAEGVLELTKRIALKTAIQYYAYTKDLTVCRRCDKVLGGLLERCPNCGSEEVDWWSRITGYYQNVAGWNKGKLAELVERRRYSLDGKSQLVSESLRKRILKLGAKGISAFDF